MAQKPCSYTFRGPDGKNVVLRGMAAIKAFLASGGLEYLRGAEVRKSAERAVTETPEFKNWFGDSKVVDAQGKPLVVYHGTDADFAVFNPGRGDLGKGIYFASAPDDAASYASPDGRGANVMPVYVSIQNPYYWTKEDRKKSADAVNAAARRAGHDGIIRTWVASDEKHIIAFRPEQIKSAVGNSGAFEPANPDITKSSERDITNELWDLTRNAEREYGLDRFDAHIEGDDIVADIMVAPESMRGQGSGTKAMKDLLAFADKWGRRVWLSPAREGDIDGVKTTPFRRLVSYYKGLGFVAARGDSSPDGIDYEMYRDPGTRRSAERPWYSQLARAIEGVPARLDNQSAVQWSQWLKANAAKMGVKADEVTWSGIEDWLKLKGKEKVSKAEIGAFLGANGVQVEEVVLGAGDRWTRTDTGEVTREESEARKWAQSGIDFNYDESDTRYGQYTLPGGTNYREVLLTLPEKKAEEFSWTPESLAARREQMINDAGWTEPGVDAAIAAARDAGSVDTALRSLDAKVASGVYSKAQKEASEILRGAVVGARNKNERSAAEADKTRYKSSHWDTKNVVAHVRLNDRVDSIGRKTLFVEELQSDFGADNRKQRANIERAVDGNFEAIVERMKSAGVLEVVCD